MINGVQIINALCKRVVDFIREKKERRGIEFIKLEYNGRGYSYKSGNSTAISILIFFLMSECGDNFFLEGYRKGIVDENWDGCAGNITMIEKEGDYIYLSDLYPKEEDEFVEMKISIDQLLKIMDEWQIIINLEKNPKYIIVKSKDDQFMLETHD